MNQKHINTVLITIPIRYFGTPNYVAAVASFLASYEAKLVT